MISIGKLTNADSAVKYLTQALADSTLDYYSLRGESPGKWDGAAAKTLGLTGQVDPDQLRLLLSGYHPATGKTLAKHWASQRIVAFDVTFSAPKSVSLLYAIGNDEVRRAVLEAHDQAVDAAIQYIQTHAAFARRYDHPRDLVYPVSADLVMPRFVHRTARPVTDPRTGQVTIDPQLHTHIVVPTWVCQDDGTWSALLSQPLYQHAAAAGAVGQAVMRKHLVQKLGIEAEVMPNGTFEIKGINEAMRREFSKRRQQIETAELMFGHMDIAGREKANLATREKKPEMPAGPELALEWKERAHKVGLTQKLVTHLLHRHELKRTFELTEESIAALVGEHGLTKENATFSHRDVVRKIAALNPDGLTLAQIEWAANQVVTSQSVLALGPKAIDGMNHPLPIPSLRAGPRSDFTARTDMSERDESARVLFSERRYSTNEMVDCERQMLAIALSRQNQGVCQVPSTVVSGAIAKHNTLTAEQRKMIEAICLSGDGVQLIEGVAGAGKTFALNTCREALQSHGHQVIGLALAGRAAQNMQEEAAIPSFTIASAIPHLLKESLPAGSVLIVDEAGMIGSRQLSQLVQLTARDNAKLVLCGDPHQLQPIDSGAGFRALIDHLGAIQLTQSVRQKELWEREALTAIRDGKIELAVDAYREHERIVVAETAMERRRQVVNAAMESTREGNDTVILTKTRDEAMAVNELTRAVRRQSGELSGEGVTIGYREFQVGDKIICTRNDSRLGLTNGLRGTVVAADPLRDELVLDTGHGNVLIPGQKYEDLDYGYALTAHKAQGITCGVALVVGSETASKEWAYSVMSRARQETRYFTVSGMTRPAIDAIDQVRDELTLTQKLNRPWSLAEAKESTLDYGGHSRL